MKKILLPLFVVIILVSVGVVSFAQSHLKEIPMHVTVLAAPVYVWVDEEMTFELTGWQLGTEIYEGNYYDYDFWVTGSIEVGFGVISTDPLPGAFTFSPSSVVLSAVPTHVVMTFNPLLVGQFDDFKLVVDEVP